MLLCQTNDLLPIFILKFSVLNFFSFDNSSSQKDFTGVDKHKLDGVGPVDNRPSTDNLHQFIQKLKK